MLKIEHLCKSYGDKKAVNDLSFKVKKGEFFAFLGVNGAGKSTTINIICGQLSKDSGTVKICVWLTVQTNRNLRCAEGAIHWQAARRSFGPAAEM